MYGCTWIASHVVWVLKVPRLLTQLAVNLADTGHSLRGWTLYKGLHEHCPLSTASSSERRKASQHTFPVESIIVQPSTRSRDARESASQGGECLQQVSEHCMPPALSSHSCTRVYWHRGSEQSCTARVYWHGGSEQSCTARVYWHGGSEQSCNARVYWHGGSEQSCTAPSLML